MEKITLKNGIVILGEKEKDHPWHGNRVITLRVEKPYLKKKYKDSSFATSTELNKNGTSRVYYRSNKADYEFNREYTIVTIPLSCVKDIRVVK